jgi:hypothetical protein
MSTIKTTTLSTLDGTATVPVNTVVNGSAKAWVNFNGTGTVAIRASFNVTSITDNNVGRFTVNMTNAMSDGNYAVVASTSATNGSNFMDAPNLFSDGYVVTAPTTSSFTVQTLQGNFGAYADPNYFCIVVFR